MFEVPNLTSPHQKAPLPPGGAFAFGSRKKIDAQGVVFDEVLE
jgi:hypothetical protein